MVESSSEIDLSTLSVGQSSEWTVLTRAQSAAQERSVGQNATQGTTAATAAENPPATATKTTEKSAKSAGF
jgi:hypothetical protein